VTVLEALFRGALARRDPYGGSFVLTGVSGEAVRAFLVFAGVHGTITALLLASMVHGVRSAPERA